MGKTTATVNLAYALAPKGQRVLAIDVDPQASLTLYCGQDPCALEAQHQTIYWSLCRDVELAALVIPGAPALVPASIQPAKAEQEFAQQWDSVSFLKEKIAPRRCSPPTEALCGGLPAAPLSQGCCVP